MDRLSSIFKHFLPSARVFYSGSGCRSVVFDAREGVGHIHILRSGPLLLKDHNGNGTRVDQPSVLFYPRPQTHTFEACDEQGPELLCASLQLGHPQSNPLVASLPDVYVVPLVDVATIAPLLQVLFSEAFNERCGRQAALDHLVSYFLILLLRHLLDSGHYHSGLLAGLSDASTASAITAVHDHPERVWTLEQLADKANMSRARFASYFRETVGITPMDYVSRWRLGLVQAYLKRGYSLKQIAPKVGYQSTAALTRTFSQKIGLPPGEWLRSNDDGGSENLMQIGLNEYRVSTSAFEKQRS